MRKKARDPIPGGRCPACGATGDGLTGKGFTEGPVEGVVTCPDCQLMWGHGSVPETGIEYWSDRKGWTRTPEGCLLVFPVMYGVEKGRTSRRPGDEARMLQD